VSDVGQGAGFPWSATDNGQMSRQFVKSGSAAAGLALQSEAEGLRALAATGTVRVPAILGLEVDEGTTTLELEWLDLRPPDAGFAERFARALAALHAAPCPLKPPAFGWPRDNFIGATPQCNAPHADWIAFFAGQRLEPMRSRLSHHIDLAAAVTSVIDRLPTFFEDGHSPRASLIHGDLWSGNWGMLPDGTPVIFDPCVSCSDAEAELAMMELFGSPPAGFWPAYREAAGLHAGYARRRPLYQLYHLLNHAVLFGGGYVQQALHCARACLD
jgi:protein-ribulosamine 3-kinase